jgi:hypothetical protein
MKIVIKENNRFKRDMFDFGWGNGYVLIPKNHPLHGKQYDEIDVSVHGGLTFSELVDAEMIEMFELEKEDEGKWCVGFDTCHFSDKLSEWSKEKVQEEAERLRDQLLSYKHV